METFETEEQQVEAIKKWINGNYKSVIGGALLGIAILFGGRTWLEQQNRHTEAASVAFETMIEGLNKDNKKGVSDTSAALSLGAQLLGEYSDTPYAVLAALSMAKIKLDEKDILTAKAHLRWALDNAQQPAVKLIARLRLARVLHSEKNYDEAMQLLTSEQTGTFSAAYEELKGDIYVDKAQTEKARTAYTLSLAKMEPTSRSKNYVQIKLDNLGEAKAPTGNP